MIVFWVWCMSVVVGAACGPRAALQVSVDVSPTDSATPSCDSIVVLTARPVPLATVQVSIVAQATAVALRANASGTGPTSTPVPRDVQVKAAIGTATAEAKLTPFPTRPAPTPRPNQQPSASRTLCVRQVLVSTTASARLAQAPARPAPSAAPPPAPASTNPRPQVGAAPQPLTASSPSTDARVVVANSPTTTLISPSVLLYSDAGSTVHLRVGDRFVLLLGQYTGGVDWHVALGTPGVLQRVGDSGQGVYQAINSGRTALTAIADPACRNARPPCAAPSRELRFDMIVT